MYGSEQIYRRLPESAKTHIIRDATLEQGLVLALWCIPGFVFLVFGLAPISLVLFLFGLWQVLPTKWGARYFVRRDKRVDRRIRKNDNVVFTPNATGRQAKNNFLVPLRIYDFAPFFGTVYNRKKKTDTVYVAIRGRQGIFSDPQERNAFEADATEVVKTTISQVASNIVFTYLNGSRPYDTTRVASYTRKHYLHDDVIQGLTPTGEYLMDQVAELIARSTNTDAQPVSFFALTVPRPASWDKHNMEETGANPELIPGSDLERLADSIVPGLEAIGYYGVELLNARQLHELIFKTWNITYVKKMFDNPEEAYSYKKLEWPERGMRAFDNYLETEDSVHAVLMLTRFRSNMIEPGGLYPLVASSIRWITVAACSATISPTLEAFVLDRTSRWREAFQNAGHPSGGSYETVKDIEKRQEPIEAYNALYYSRSKAIRFGDPIVISAENKEQLEQNIKKVEAILRELRIVGVRVEGPSRLLRTFFAGALGLRT